MRIARLIIGLSVTAWLLAAPVVPSYAKTSNIEMTLDDAILLALRYNPSIQNAEIQRVIDKFNLRLAENNYEVQYALTGGATYTSQAAAGASTISNSFDLTPTATIMGGPGKSMHGTTLSVTQDNPLSQAGGNQTRTYNPSVKVSLTQPLLQGFSKDVNMAPLRTAQDTELVNKLNLKNSVITTITTVISQYITVVGDENRIKADQNSLKDSMKTLDETRAYIKAGQKPRTDLLQAQASVSSQQLSMQQDVITLENDRLSLINSLGLDPNTPITVSPQVKLADEHIPGLTDSIQLALDNNITYQTSVIQLRNTKRQLIVDQDALRTQLNLTLTDTQGAGSGGGSLNAGISSVTNGQNHNTAVGLQLTVPISNMQQRAAVVQDRVTIKQAETTLESDKHNLIAQVTSSYKNLQILKANIQQAHQATVFAEQTLRIAQIKYKYGKSSQFEISSLQTALLNQQISEIAAQTSYITSLVNYDALLATSLDRWHINVRY